MSSTNQPKTPVGQVHVILPAFNEEESLPNLLRRFAQLNREHPELDLIIRVIDDGSSDRTAAVAAQPYDALKVRVHSHPKNLGLGQAMLTGVQRTVAWAKANDVIVAMDADDTHDVNLIPKMAVQLADGACISIASRFVDGGCDATAPPFRRLLSRGASVVFHTVFPLEGIRDFTSGYRMYRAELLNQAVFHWGERLIEENGFACMVELLLKLRHWEPEIQEVPMLLRYDRKMSASKLRLFRTLRQYLVLAIRNAVTPAPRPHLTHA